jgi:DNA-binding transcriptional ArsR family regulator
MIYNEMVVDQRRTEGARRTDRLFHALADATRRDIVTQTLGRERSVTELARLCPMSFAAVQKHVAVLADAGLVSKHRRRREQLVRGELGRVREVHRLLDELEAGWRDRLDRFGAVLADDLGHDLSEDVAADPSSPSDSRSRRKHS